MYLFDSWDESFALLKPRNFKVLVFSSLQAMSRSWLVFFAIFMAAVFFSYLIDAPLGSHKGDFGVASIIAVLFYFLISLVKHYISASKNKLYKGDDLEAFYNWRYDPRYFWCPPSSKEIAKTFTPMRLSWALVFPLVVLALIPISHPVFVILFPVVVFLVLFWLDSDRYIEDSFYSLFKSIVFFLLSLPFLLPFIILPYYIFYKFGIPMSSLFARYIAVALLMFYVIILGSVEFSKF